MYLEMTFQRNQLDSTLLTIWDEGKKNIIKLIEVILVSDYYSMEFGKGKGNGNVLNKES